MATKTKSKKASDDMLITLYMNYVLEHEVTPKSIFKFCKSNDLDEAVFYEYFGSFDGLQKAIWSKFFTNTEALMLKNEAYGAFSNKEKMLTFFFSFFELLTLNRSYVLFALESNRNMVQNMAQLKGLRMQIKGFATRLINDGNAEKKSKISRHNPTVFSEGAWLQFMFLLKFWMDDESAAFEKTDMAIEKSVNTIFDLFDNTPLDNIIDFGKFLFKEKMA